MGGLPNGEGVKIIAADNTTIEGTFRNGLAFGRGKMTRENKGTIELAYEGEWK